MKLTQAIRQAFIRSVMNDVPSVDFKEEIRSIVFKDAVQQMPAKVRALVNDPECEQWLNQKIMVVDTVGASAHAVYFPRTTSCRQRLKLSDGADVLVRELVKKDAAQKVRLDRMKESLTSVVYSATTLAALVKALPEFERYLPADDSAAQKVTLPVLANLVSDFMKAGWPKGEKTSRAAA